MIEHSRKGTSLSFSRAAAASVSLAAVLLAGPTGAVAAPGDPTPSSVSTSAAPASTPAATPAVPLPGIQTAAPGNVQTPPAAPTAPSEPFPWPIIVFGVLGIVLLVVWAVLTRRARDAERAPETDDGDPA